MKAMNQILECKWCLLPLLEPIILPCGDSVCQLHVEDLEKSDWRCMTCNGVHKLPDGDHFPINKALQSLLDITIGRSRSSVHTDAKECLSELELKQQQLTQALKEPDDFIFSLLNKYKNQVDLRREELKAMVDEICLEKIDEITAFKATCEEALKQNKSKLADFHETIEAKIKDWNKSLDKPAGYEFLWNKVIDETEEYTGDIEYTLRENLKIPDSILYPVKSIDHKVWIKLSSFYKNSVWIDNFWDIIRQKSCREYKSEVTSDRGYEFDFKVALERAENGMRLAATISRQFESKPFTKLSWRLNIFGANGRLIMSKIQNYDGSGTIIINDYISANQIWDELTQQEMQDDLIRVEASIHQETSDPLSKSRREQFSALLNDLAIDTSDNDDDGSVVDSHNQVDESGLEYLEESEADTNGTNDDEEMTESHDETDNHDNLSNEANENATAYHHNEEPDLYHTDYSDPVDYYNDFDGLGFNDDYDEYGYDDDPDEFGDFGDDDD